MAKKQKHSSSNAEMDSSYILKLVLYLIIGTQWLYVVDGAETWQLPIPIGFVIGLMFAAHDHFRIDRKIEYALLLVAAFVGFWAHVGVQFLAN